MKNNKNVLYSLTIILAGVINFGAQAQQKEGTPDAVATKGVKTPHGPNGIARTIKQDRKGAIWITSWEGVFKYDGTSFTNVTANVSSARFFSVLEDSRGNFWFASIGSGVYYYDGKSFKNFTTKDGLTNDSVTNIYEDATGTIWFGTLDGISRYDRKSFKNLKISEAPAATPSDSVYTGANPVHTATDSVYNGPKVVRNEGDSVHVSSYRHVLPQVHYTHNDVNAIAEYKTGKFWMGTRGYATVYDGKAFTTLTNKDGKPFTNVRCIIKDRKGNMWLGGADGLWRFDGTAFTNLTRKFVGYIYEDKKGNIWTSSETENSQVWVLSRYDVKTLYDKKPTVTEITNKPMIFGILEDNKGNIWFGGLDGVYRYDGKKVTGFKAVAGKK